MLGKDRAAGANPKRELGSNSKMKGKESKQKRATSLSIKKDESRVIAKPLKMTKVSSSEKASSGIQKQISKRKIPSDHANTTGGAPRKVGRPRSQSTASDIGKGKHRNTVVSSSKHLVGSDYQHHNGRMTHEELLEKFRGNHICV